MAALQAHYDPVDIPKGMRRSAEQTRPRLPECGHSLTKRCPDLSGTGVAKLAPSFSSATCLVLRLCFGVHARGRAPLIPDVSVGRYSVKQVSCHHHRPNNEAHERCAAPPLHVCCEGTGWAA
jgi:hypothetical protein